MVFWSFKSDNEVVQTIPDTRRVKAHEDIAKETGCSRNGVSKQINAKLNGKNWGRKMYPNTTKKAALWFLKSMLTLLKKIDKKQTEQTRG